MLTRRCFAIFCYLDARNGHLSLMRALRCSRVYLTATVVTCERLCASDNHGLLIYDMSAGNVDDGFRFYVIGFPVYSTSDVRFVYRREILLTYFCL